MAEGGLGDDSPYKVLAVKTLGKTNDSEVRKQLDDAVKQVEPIMRSRKWSVPLLTEFEPKNACLLGLNVGGGGGRTQVIKIRVRQPGRKNDLFPYTHTLGTLLHELVHNVIGAHSAKFYSMLDEITQECEDLMAKGIYGPGHGFDGKSAGRVGGGIALNPPEHKLNDLARKAAETRAQQHGVMPTGGRRLGGNSIASRNMTPAQAAAFAAERRAKDNAWCSCQQSGPEIIEIDISDTSGAGPSNEHFASGSKAAPPRSQQPPCRASEDDIIDLTLEEDGADHAAVSIPNRCIPGKRRRSVEGSMPVYGWTCKLCTLINAKESSHCLACNTWRYSTGAPVATAVPAQVNGQT